MVSAILIGAGLGVCYGCIWSHFVDPKAKAHSTTMREIETRISAITK